MSAMTREQWHGVFPAITTPFAADGSVDHDFLASHAKQLVDAGCRAVVSARGPQLELPREELLARIQAEIAAVAGPSPAPAWTQVIVEKRATFACRPGVRRPAGETPLANFYLCGDYVASDYPATLEAAVRSGVACARLVS